MSIGSSLGEGRLVGKEWAISGDPFMLVRLENVFVLSKRSKDRQTVYLPATPETSRELLWFTQMYPLNFNGDQMRLRSLSAKHLVMMKRCSDIIEGKVKPAPIRFARGESPRDYQLLAAALFTTNQSLLLADDVGTGKTVSAISSLLQPDIRPACVILPGHLIIQWKAALKRFVPQLKVHVIDQMMPYDLRLIVTCPSCEAVVDMRHDRTRNGACPICKRVIPQNTPRRVPDVTLLAYSKMLEWGSFISSNCRSLIIDEAHALRGGDKTKRWEVCVSMCRRIPYKLLMTATPIFNLGGEAWNLLECSHPGLLGPKDEFNFNWCHSVNGKYAISDPAAFNSYLTSTNVMLRRTAKELGIPVHDCQLIHQTVEADASVFANATTEAEELARLLLEGAASRTKGVDMMEFGNMMRQATGLAKASSVAEFTKGLLEQGESVVLFAYHHACHDIYMEKLKDWNPVRYTGRESAAEKNAAVERFIRGDSKVICISLRAGEGLDGLQQASCTVVVGEFDWTWAVLKQNVGRIAREGQTRPCLAYLLSAEFGFDPTVMQLLGLKRDQLNGILGEKIDEPTRKLDVTGAIRQIAAEYLQRR